MTLTKWTTLRKKAPYYLCQNLNYIHINQINSSPSWKYLCSELILAGRLENGNTENQAPQKTEPQVYLLLRQVTVNTCSYSFLFSMYVILRFQIINAQIHEQIQNFLWELARLWWSLLPFPLRGGVEPLWDKTKCQYLSFP